MIVVAPPPPPPRPEPAPQPAPSLAPALTASITVSLTPEEKTRTVAAAKAAGLSTSAYCRRRIVGS